MTLSADVLQFTIMNALTENYFDRLDQVREAIEARLIHAKAKLLAPDHFFSFTSGISYGTTAELHGELSEYNGRPTRKFAHASVYRLESGKYELTFYVL